MLENIAEYFLEEPKRITAVGQVLARCGIVLIMAGLGARILVAAQTGIQLIGHKPTGTVYLADVLPSLPTWWIPESFVGFFISICFTGAGLYYIHLGRRLTRYMKGR